GNSFHRCRGSIDRPMTGAEIEKPLAIVVVGGLVTRPIKIVILPMVYEWVERRATRKAEVTID
ncbi:MAG TPA: hypothetical protein VK117_12700, partial [Pyrinomonadaceae bacterium]|nr:hypothetical protein [Pyrinomonadaceae bacterium]